MAELLDATVRRAQDSPDRDKRGVKRQRETSSSVCQKRKCPPGAHKKIASKNDLVRVSRDSPLDGCRNYVPKYNFCDDGIYFGQIPASLPMSSYGASAIQQATQIKDPSVCAIEDCYNPRHVDENGKVHECCGSTHAMELMRRKSLEGLLNDSSLFACYIASFCEKLSSNKNSVTVCKEIHDL